MTAVTPERGEGLKPCPFCGGPATTTDGMGEHWVLCRPCGANGTASSKQSAAIAAWNTRPAPPPTVTDEVVGVLRAMTACAVDYLASGDATAQAVKEGIWGEKVQEARSTLATMEKPHD
jgi:Lar family restriction alleviation protein